MVKTSLIKKYLGNWTGENLQEAGRRKRRKRRLISSSQKKLRGYRKEERAFIKSKKKVNKILLDKSALMPRFRNKPMKLNKL